MNAHTHRMKYIKVFISKIYVLPSDETSTFFISLNFSDYLFIYDYLRPGAVARWHASGPEFDPHVRHILSWRLGHENISTAILPLPLIQEEQLSVTGERMCTKYW